MIAYNNKWLYNKHVQAQADEALHEQCIDQPTHAAIYKQHDVKFYTPNFFVRIGLAILALIILTFITALFALMMGVSSGATAYLFMFMGVVSYAAAEILISSKHHYNSGLDNMLVWMAAAFMWTGIAVKMLIDHTWYSTPESPGISADIKLSVAGLVICTLLAIRFADTFMSVVATICLWLTVFYCCVHVHAMPRVATLFIMILLSGLICYISGKPGTSRAALLYRNCSTSVYITSLAVLYLSGNYYVADTIYHSGDLFDSYVVEIVQARSRLSLGWFFWAWTFLIPVIYIGIGIRKRKITLVRVGIPLLALAVLTFRYYYHIMSPEMAMMLGGMVVFIVSYSLINRLHTPHGGFTFNPETFTNDSPDMGKMLTSELINNAGAGGQNHVDNDWG